MTYEEAINTIAEKYEAEKMECTCSPCEKCASIKLHKNSVEEAEKVVAVYEKVRKILSHLPVLKIVDINKESNLKEDLGMENVDIHWINVNIGIECDVKITHKDWFNNKIITVEDIVNSVFQKMKRRDKMKSKQKFNEKCVQNIIDNISGESITLSSDNTKAYIADGSNGLVILDMSNKDNIIKLNTNTHLKWISSIALSSDEKIAYIAFINNIVVLDVSDIYHTKEIAKIYIGESLNDIQISKCNRYAYIISNYKLTIIDLSIQLFSRFYDKNGSKIMLGDRLEITIDNSKKNGIIYEKNGAIMILDKIFSKDMQHKTKIIKSIIKE